MGLTYRGVYADDVVDSYGRAIFDNVNLGGSAYFSDILLVQLYGNCTSSTVTNGTITKACNLYANCISDTDTSNTIHILVHTQGNISSESALNSKIQVEVPIGPNIMGNIMSQGTINGRIYNDVNRQLIPHSRSIVLRNVIISDRPLRT